MPHLSANGVQLFYESTGDGDPVIFSHEFGGGYRSWQPQVSAFARLYRCVVYNHRGFPPSSVPDQLDAYTQDLLVEDLRALLDHLGFERAHLVGLSMGGNVALNFALRWPERARSIVVAGTGTGSVDRAQFERDIQAIVETLESGGMAAFAERYPFSPTRTTFRRKDPRGWAEFRDQLADHSPLGSALTMRGVLWRRPTIFALEERLRRLRVPTLVLVGDEDEPCLDPALFLRRTVPSAGLVVLPQTGHTVNLEEPALFNQSVLDFLRLVEAGRWGTREEVSSRML